MIPMLLILGDLAFPTALTCHQPALLTGYWASSITHTRLDSALAQLSSAMRHSCHAQVGRAVRRSSRSERHHPSPANIFNYVLSSSGQVRDRVTHGQYGSLGASCHPAVAAAALEYSP